MKLPFNYNKKFRVNLTGVILSILLIIIVAHMFSVRSTQLALDNQTWLPISTHQKIESLQDSPVLLDASKQGKYPVFLVYDEDSSLLSYVENFIKMEVGPCYIYYGQLFYYLLGQPTPDSFFKNQYERDISSLYFNKLKDDAVLSELSSHPLVLVTPDFYVFDNGTLAQLQDFQYTQGIYIITDNDFIKIPKVQILPGALGLTNPPEDFYTYATDWSVSEKILEYFVEKTGPIYCKVSYPIYMFETNLTLNIRLYDAAYDWGNVSFFLDQKFVGSYSYGGTGSPIWLSYNLIAEEGLHTLYVELESKDHGILRLDLLTVENRRD